MAAISAGVAVIFSCTAFILYTGKFKGEQLFKEKTIELGEKPDTDVSDYVSGSSWVYKHTRIDTSGVNTLRVGDYEVKAENPFDTYIYTIHVRDTTPPELNVGYGWKNVLEAGRTYDLNVIGAEAYDLSGLAFIKYFYEGQEIEELLFDEPGRPEIKVRATDGNANMTEKTVRLFVDTPPEFYGVHDQYLLRGSDISDLDPVFAKDEVDGGLTSEIERDLSGLDLNNIGDYKVTYRVKDGYGLESSAFSTVHVVSSKQRVAAHANDCIILKDDLKYAVDEGYFTYEPLKEPDREWVLDNCEASLVNLYVQREDGSSSSGSAFIYEVTPEYVYMVSVYHVTNALEREPLWITFYDGSRIRTTIRSIRLSAGNEASLFRIAVGSIPYHTLVRLKEVACDSDIYDYVKAGTPLMEYCKNWRGGEVPTIEKDVNVISFELSKIQKQYVDDDSYYTATRRSVSGMSGTAVFDYRGMLAGICSKTMYPLNEEEPMYRDGCDFILKVDDLDELMERAKELAK